MAAESHNSRPGQHSRALLILTSVYALLYGVFIASGQYGTAGSEPTVVRLLFLVFLVGYAVTWKHEGLGGAIFVVWWAGMWYLGLFVAQQERGAAIVMGFPLFVLAILLIRAWYRRRHSHATAR